MTVNKRRQQRLALIDRQLTQHGVLRLVSTALLRDFARDLASKTRNPAFVS